MIKQESSKKQEVKTVSLKEWPCRLLSQIYRLNKQIGQGAYGSVYDAIRIVDDKKFALKKMENFDDKDNKDKDQKDNKDKQKQANVFGFPITTLREVKLLQKLEHQNILKINDVVFQKFYRRPPIIYLCLDLMDTDLGYLVRDKDYIFTLFRIQKIAKQILEGLAYLHKNSIAHRDLKPANILMNREGIVKVADFGLAKKLSRFSTTHVVTMWYRAPELFFGIKSYTTNIDIWSLGCVLSQFIIGRPLFGHCKAEKQEVNSIFSLVGTPDKCEWQQIEKLQSYSLQKPEYSIESNVIYHLKKLAPQYEHDNLLLDLIQKMLRLNPHSRYSAQQCLKHDFFSMEYEEQALLPEYILEKKNHVQEGTDYVGKRQKYN